MVHPNSPQAFLPIHLPSHSLNVLPQILLFPDSDADPKVLRFCM